MEPEIRKNVTEGWPGCMSDPRNEVEDSENKTNSRGVAGSAPEQNNGKLAGVTGLEAVAFCIFIQEIDGKIGDVHK